MYEANIANDIWGFYEDPSVANALGVLPPYVEDPRGRARVEKIRKGLPPNIQESGKEPIFRRE